jgi:hypothetical protein
MARDDGTNSAYIDRVNCCAAPGATGYRFEGGHFVSIVRVGLAETKKFAEGYDAIFGKKSTRSPKGKKAKPSAKGRTAKKKSIQKKK